MAEGDADYLIWTSRDFSNWWESINACGLDLGHFLHDHANDSGVIDGFGVTLSLQSAIFFGVNNSNADIWGKEDILVLLGRRLGNKIDLLVASRVHIHRSTV